MIRARGTRPAGRKSRVRSRSVRDFRPCGPRPASRSSRTPRERRRRPRPQPRAATHVHRDGPGLLDRPAARDLGAVGQERGEHQQHADEPDLPQQFRGEQRPVRRARRPSHDAGRLWLERHGETEEHRRGHVDPQDLHGHDRQRRTGQHGDEDDHALADVGRHGPRDERRRLSKTPRPSSTAASMVAKSSSSRTMSAAPRAASVPPAPIATPMSARRNAGASFTPSPVMATTWPRSWSAWSPVIIFTRTPASRVASTGDVMKDAFRTLNALKASFMALGRPRGHSGWPVCPARTHPRRGNHQSNAMSARVNGRPGRSPGAGARNPSIMIASTRPGTRPAASGVTD
jgi:hypothetical protein